MEEILKQILSEVQELSKRMDNLESEVITIKSDMATKTQQDENSGFIQALISRTDIIDAKLDGLTVTTANKEVLEQTNKSIDRIASISFLVRKAADHDDDIRALRKAQ